MNLSIRDHTKIPPKIWTDLVMLSADSWFWHTRDWANYSLEILGAKSAADVSFGIFQDEKLLAIAPSMLVQTEEGRSSLLFGQQPMPWPAFAPDLDGRLRKLVEQEIFERYYSIAQENRCSSVELFGVVMAESFYRSGKPVGNYPLRYGYKGTDHLTQVVDLTLPKETLWRSVRKGHRAAIKKAEKELEISVLSGPGFGDEFREYQKLHEVASGRATRSQKTFDDMKEWLSKKNAILVGAKLNNVWVGFVLLMVFKKGGFYASACNHPVYEERLGIGHALIWNGMLAAKESGIELLEMGLQTYEVTGRETVHNKSSAISSFKRGFGGFQMPRFQAELRMLDKNTD